jgi:GT2 family glycosyltransferase
MDQEPESASDYLISIIIATFNAGEHLKACLLSIAALSTEKKIEVIVLMAEAGSDPFHPAGN